VKQGADFQSFLRRSREILWKVTEPTKKLGKSYDDDDYRSFPKKLFEKVAKNLEKLQNFQKMTS